MNPHLISLYVVIPMLAGIVSIALHRFLKARAVWSLAMLGGNVALGLWGLWATFGGQYDDGSARPGHILVSQMGNWPAPFGITLVLDPLAAIMLLIAGIVCFSVFIYCLTQLPDRFSGSFFVPLFHFQLFGVNWSFVTGDLFNLFVAFEIMLMASYALCISGNTKNQMRQAYKYILLNLIGSTMFVTCAGLLYGQLGTLNMADLTRIAMSGNLPPSSIPVIVMLLLVFGGKSAVFPLWFWLPDSYPTLPAAVGGLFAGLLTKVGAYVMIRVFVMMFGPSTAVAQTIAPIILTTAAVTMFLGVIGAVSMHSVRSILSIHIISQVGYMVLGVGLGITAIAALGGADSAAMIASKELAVAGAIFFIIHNMVVKSCLFLCGGLMQRHAGSDDLNKIGGILRRAPWLAVLFMIAAMSLAGLPPLSGFFGKFVLIREGWRQGFYTITAFAIATSLLTLLSMLKIWSYGFWSPPQGRHVAQPTRIPNTRGGMLAVTILVLVALSMGLGAQQYLDLAKSAAKTLVSPGPYVQAVLGSNADFGTRNAEVTASGLGLVRADEFTPRLVSHPSSEFRVPKVEITEDAR
jgi:multicomponent Na+:H+ antiporter subunit D